MSKTLQQLILDELIPRNVLDKMNATEYGLLSTALEAMVYARSHTKNMESQYPEKVHMMITSDQHWQAEKLGVEMTKADISGYIKSDVVIARVIALLDGLALKEVLKEL